MSLERVRHRIEDIHNRTGVKPATLAVPMDEYVQLLQEIPPVGTTTEERFRRPYTAPQYEDCVLFMGVDVFPDPHTIVYGLTNKESPAR